MDIGTLTGQIEIEDMGSRAITLFTSKVTDAAHTFDDFAGGILVGSVAVAAAIGTITASIIALGNRGSDVNDLAASFEKFSGSAENADASMRAMREGTLGVVTDFDLMQSATKLLAANVKLTSAEFGLMTQAATVLQNQGLGGTKENLDLVSQAMLTGRTRTLEMRIGKIDLIAAETKYAASLGKLRSELTSTQTLEARRVGILDALNRRVQEAGVQTRDFGEMMQAAVVWIRNTGDQLASLVAKSPAVINAAKAVGDAFMNAFGNNAQAVITKIAGWVDMFANAVAYWAPIIIKWVADIATKVQALANKVLEYWDTLPDWFKNIAKEATVTAGVLYVSTQAIQAVGKASAGAAIGVADIATTISGSRDAFISFKESMGWMSNSGTAAKISAFMHVVIEDIKKMGLVTVITTDAQILWSAFLSGPLMTAISGVGGAIVTFFTGPIGLAVIAVGALVGGLRLLAGSWDFITVPAKFAWQILKDVWTVGTDLVKMVGEELSPVLSDLGEIFGDIATIIGNEFRDAIDQAKYEIKLLIDLIKDTPTFRRFIAEMQMLHDMAEDARRRERDAMPAVGDAFIPPVMMQGLAPENFTGGTAVGNLNKRVKIYTEEELQDIEAFRKAVQGIQDELFGKNATDQAKKYAAAIGDVKNLNKLNAEQQKRVNDVLMDAINAYSRLGREAPKNVQDLQKATGELALKTAVSNVNTQMSSLVWGRLRDIGQKNVETFEKMTGATHDWVNFLTKGIPVVNGVGKGISEIGEQIDIVYPKWAKFSTFQEIIYGEGGIRDTLKDIPKLMTDAFTGGGGIMGSLKALGVQITEAITKPLLEAFKKLKIKGGELALGIGSSIAAGVGGAAGGTTGATLAGIAGTIGGLAATTGLLGAGMATLTSTAIGLGVATAGIGLAAVGAYVAFKKFFTVSKDVKEARAAALDFGDAISDSLTAIQKAEAGGVKWKETLIGVRDAYSLVGKSAAEAQEDVAALMDTGNPARSATAMAKIAANFQIADNIKGVRALVQEYIGAGEVIPQQLQKNIDKLVMMGKLTKDNATQLLDLTKSAVPAFADVEAAAGRLGIQVSALGSGVQAIRVTEMAEQMVKDFKTLELANADWNAVMAGSQKKVQELVTDAMNLGVALPKSLEPYVKRMAEAGLLTDNLGNKMEDTSKLTWAETLTEKVEKLVDAMMKLVDAITGVGGAIDGVNQKQINPRINTPSYVPSGSMTPDIEEPSYYADWPSSRIVAFKPRGSDTVPAMLSPGERVVRDSDVERGDITIINELDGEVLTRAVLKNARKQTKRIGVSRR